MSFIGDKSSDISHQEYSSSPLRHDSSHQQPSFIVTSVDSEEFTLILSDDDDSVDPTQSTMGESMLSTTPLSQSNEQMDQGKDDLHVKEGQLGNQRVYSPHYLSAASLQADAHGQLVSSSVSIEKGLNINSKEKSKWNRLFHNTIHRSRSAGSNMPQYAEFVEKHFSATSTKKRTSPITDGMDWNERRENVRLETPRRKSLLNIANEFTRKLSIGSFKANTTANPRRRNSTLLPSSSCSTLPVKQRERRLSASNTVQPEVVDDYVNNLTRERLMKFAQSFNHLLEDEVGVELFHTFLYSEYSEENILFWKACQDYKRISSSKKREKEARRIFQEFLTAQAPKEINLDSRTRIQTVSTLHSPQSNTFEHAEKKIHTLMEGDSYPRFLRSSFYQELLSKIGGSSSSI